MRGWGGTKTVNVERVIDLAPDVIIASKEENEKEQVEALAERCAVYVVDVNSYREALRAVTDLGEILRRPDEAVSLVKRIEDGFARLRPLAPPVRTAYLIWRDPYRAAGKGTCIHSIMQRCGLENVCAILDGRYPELTSRLLPGLSPQLVLLGSEPYPFDEIHIDEIRTLLPEADVLLADGEMFTWYGARMVEAAEYLAGLVEQIRQRVGES